MLSFLFSLLFFWMPFGAICPDPNATTFELKPKAQFYVDVFDFSKNYPNLENIDVDAKRKKRVEFLLTGEFPVLETLNYVGTFGEFSGKFTGKYPKLTSMHFCCTSCAMNFDFTGEWEKSCTANIQTVSEDIVIKLPTDIGVIVYTQVGLKGKASAPHLQKKGKGFLRKVYQNSLAETADIVLTLNVQTKEGRILIK